MKSALRVLLAVSVLTAGVWGNGLFAGPKPGAPVTTANPEIPLDELSLRLNPLTRAELVVEADGWLKLLQTRAQ